MSAKQKARLIVLPVLLTMLFVSLRYTLRPVDLYTLMPELEVDQIDVLIIRSGGGPSEDRSFTLKAEDPEFPRVLSRLEELRFKRSAMGPVIQARRFWNLSFPPAQKPWKKIRSPTCTLALGKTTATAPGGPKN